MNNLKKYEKYAKSEKFRKNSKNLKKYKKYRKSLKIQKKLRSRTDRRTEILVSNIGSINSSKSLILRKMRKILCFSFVDYVCCS